MKFIRLLAAGMAVVALLVGCGGGGGDETAGGDAARTVRHQGDLKKLQMSMEGYASPPDAGILVADRHGYFADVGLNLTIIGAVRPEYSIEYAADGSSAVVVTQLPEVVRADAEGKRVVVIGSLLTEPAMAM